MLAIFLRTIKDRKISLSIYCISGALLMWMYIVIFPSIQKKSESYQQLLQAYPEGLMKMFGIADIGVFRFENFLAIEQFSMLWGIVVMFLLIAIAGSAISGEIERGTIEILLSKPVARLKIFFAKYFTGLAALFLFTVFSIFSVFPLAALHGVEHSFLTFLFLFTISLLFGWTVLSMAMMFSAMFSERGKTYMAVGATLVLMYIANMVSILFEKLSWLGYTSFFYYFDHGKALIQGELNGLSVILFISVIAIFTTIGAVWFKKRDIAV